eukprot:scaffold8447_cov66-Cyclotella_meneghiniana.AAC.13
MDSNLKTVQYTVVKFWKSELKLPDGIEKTNTKEVVNVKIVHRKKDATPVTRKKLMNNLIDNYLSCIKADTDAGSSAIMEPSAVHMGEHRGQSTWRLSFIGPNGQRPCLQQIRSYKPPIRIISQLAVSSRKRVDKGRFESLVGKAIGMLVGCRAGDERTLLHVKIKIYCHDDLPYPHNIVNSPHLTTGASLPLLAFIQMTLGGGRLALGGLPSRGRAPISPQIPIHAKYSKNEGNLRGKLMQPPRQTPQS